MEINSLAEYFFGITDFCCAVDRTLSRPFLLKVAFGMLGLRAWSDDLNVVLFEFLEDDTKPNQPTKHNTTQHTTQHN